MTDPLFDDRPLTAPTAKPYDGCVVLSQDERRQLVTCAEAERYAADILRACAAARAYTPPKKANTFNRRSRA